MKLGRWVLSLLVLLAAAPSLAQTTPEIRTTITLTTGTNVSFDLQILNNSTAPRSIASVQLTLSNATFDTFGNATGPAQTYTPNVGANADGTSAPAVTIAWASPLLPGQAWNSTGGDIDSTQPTAVSARITYDNGTIIDRPLVLSGAVWSVAISQPTAPIPTGDLRLTWEPPTMNEDGSPYTNPAGYKIYYGSMQGAYANSRTINDPAARSYLLDMLPYGEYYVVATAFNTLMAESDYSNEVRGVSGADPGEPVLAIPVMTGAVTTEPEVYTLIQSRDNGVMFPFGTAPIGTPCNGRIGFLDEQRGAMYVIPKSAVTFEPGADAELLFAKCAN